jgi:alkanesulfonate monooxygenase SsuD/methylene tetrahydromethanopterin reductase-like flavin-dependent oxidoreductase (luciferase family)
VDVISRGRLDLGIGKGYAPHEFLGYGIPRVASTSFQEQVEEHHG